MYSYICIYYPLLEVFLILPLPSAILFIYIKPLVIQIVVCLLKAPKMSFLMFKY